MSDAQAQSPAETLLYLNGVTVSFDGFKALNELSLIVEKGELRTIIGPNGAGKTTMMDVITGKTRPDAGEVFFDGTEDLTRLDESAIANLGIGRKFQRPTVFEHLSVYDNLLLSLAGDRNPRFALWAKETPRERARLGELLATIRLGDDREPRRRARRQAGGEAAAGHPSHRRRDVDDAAAAGVLEHQRHRGDGQCVGGGNVEGEGAFEVLRRRGQQAVGHGAADVVDDDVQSPERFDGLSRQLGGDLGLSQIADDDVGAPASGADLLGDGL